MKVKQIIHNKVIFYLSTRYITYTFQFITSMIIAVKLGPYYMGIWGFVLLVLSYFQQIHFGIANSFNVLYVHNIDNEQECKNYIGNSMALLSYLAILVVLFYCYYLMFGIKGVEKFNAEKYVIWICVLAVLYYFVMFFGNLLRVKNLLNHVAFNQSIVVILTFLVVLLFSGEKLITMLIAAYVVGYSLCILLTIQSHSLPNPRDVDFSTKYQKEILEKGIFLFLYNTCFYFIVTSVRTIISGNYSVEEFGMFTFAFSLAHAILLLLEAISYIIFPKVIKKLSSLDKTEVRNTLNILRHTYISSAHFLIYAAMICFPLLLYFLPKYEGSLTVMNLIALTVLMNTTGYGYCELLIARNMEKLSSLLSAIALFLNILLSLILVYIFHVSFSYVIIATLITYMLYSIVIIIIGNSVTDGVKWWQGLRTDISIGIIIPYLVALVISIAQWEQLIYIPLLLFIVLNFKDISKMKEMVVSVIKKPEIVNI